MSAIKRFLGAAMVCGVMGVSTLAMAEPVAVPAAPDAAASAPMDDLGTGKMGAGKNCQKREGGGPGMMGMMGMGPGASMGKGMGMGGMSHACPKHGAGQGCACPRGEAMEGRVDALEKQVEMMQMMMKMMMR